MSIRDLFTRSPKGSEVSSQAAPSTDQDVGIEISGTMPDLGNPELNQLAQTLLAMSAKFTSQQAEANAKIRQDMANAYSEASSAGAASSGGDAYLPRRGGGNFSIRYRNDTRDKSDPSGTHRLEWIAKNTATDPDTGNPWPDDQWSTVLNGEVMSE